MSSTRKKKHFFDGCKIRITKRGRQKKKRYFADSQDQLYSDVCFLPGRRAFSLRSAFGTRSLIGPIGYGSKIRNPKSSRIIKMTWNLAYLELLLPPWDSKRVLYITKILYKESDINNPNSHFPFILIY